MSEKHPTHPLHCVMLCCVAAIQSACYCLGVNALLGRTCQDNWCLVRVPNLLLLLIAGLRSQCRCQYLDQRVVSYSGCRGRWLRPHSGDQHCFALPTIHRPREASPGHCMTCAQRCDWNCQSTSDTLHRQHETQYNTLARPSNTTQHNTTQHNTTTTQQLAEKGAKYLQVQFLLNFSGGRTLLISRLSTATNHFFSAPPSATCCRV
jgi:hypothetical protein